jgi:hypothetical protein
VIFAKARPAQMIFITTSNIYMILRGCFASCISMCQVAFFFLWAYELRLVYSTSKSAVRIRKSTNSCMYVSIVLSYICCVMVVSQHVYSRVSNQISATTYTCTLCISGTERAMITILALSSKMLITHQIQSLCTKPCMSVCFMLVSDACTKFQTISSLTAKNDVWSARFGT